jgi:peptide-methionine (S)-S-oxide reductase
MEELLRAIPGVIDTDVGYTGGWVANPRYEDTHHSKSGHAEAVRVVFDPAVLAYETLLRDWFFRMHDPTTADRQGNDIGTQYRSAIYFANEAQRTAAETSRDRFQEKLTAAGYGPITTEIAPLGDYFYAEPYHQQYLGKVPNGYCGLGGTGVSCPAGLLS